MPSSSSSSYSYSDATESLISILEDECYDECKDVRLVIQTSKNIVSGSIEAKEVRTNSTTPSDPAAQSSTNNFQSDEVSEIGAIRDGQPMEGGPTKLTDWIASQRKMPCRQTHFFEQVAQILTSLVYQIVHGYSNDGRYTSNRGGELDGDSDVDEKIFVHPNFITIDNVIIHKQTQSSTAVGITKVDSKKCGRKNTVKSASFVEWGDSIFFTEGGDDETLTKHLALYALGSIAFTMCMMGDGPSTYQLNFPHENGTSETSASAALSLSDTLVVAEEDEILLDLIRKKFRTTTSKENNCSGLKSAMLNAGIPFPFCRFVSDLLDNGHGQLFRSDYSFSSFRDVQSDLMQMLSNPERFLHSSNPDRWKLIFEDKLYGRSADIKALIDAADRVASQTNDPLFDRLARSTGKKTEIVMVSGSPGSGKSRLVRIGGKRLEKGGWRILQCKFDRVVHSEPLSIIARAFDDFFWHYVCSPEQGMTFCSDNSIAVDAAAGNRSCVSAHQQLQTRLRLFIRPEGLEILAIHIPSLRILMGMTLPLVLPDVNTAIMTELFSRLLNAMSSERNPIFFFIDDLQWADPLSLTLLMALIRGAQPEGIHFSTDNANNQNKIETIGPEDDAYIMFVGSYRNNTLEDNPPLAKAINKLRNDDTINMMNIMLSGMTVEILNEMLSDILSIPKRRVKSLSELVIQKTDGLPLYVIEFLRALKTDNLLTHSLTRGWEWDEDSIDIFPITESAAELFAFKLQRLPKDILLGMQIVSIFGTQVDQQTINLVKNYDGKESVDIYAALNVAQTEGLIERAANLICFSHDLIQKATVDSIREDDRVPLLRKLILVLIKEASATNLLNSMLFVAVDLINRKGCNLVYCERERALFAELNWRAGLKAVAVPDFAGAAIYAERGIALLSETCWETQYDLSLRLYETAVLAHFSNNTDDRELLMSRINTIFERARNFSDKFKAHRVWTQVLATTQLPIAIKQCLVALEQLGEPLDLSNIDYIKACEELLNHEVRFSGAKDVLLSKPVTDGNKEMAMAMMSSLILYYNQSKSFLGAVVSCRMLEMSMNFGYSADSVYGAAAFAVSLVTCLGDIDGGNFWGREAMDLMKLCGKPSLAPTISASLYAFVFVWKEPFQSTLEFLAEGIRSSFMYGYIDYAKVFTQCYISRSFNIGKNIGVLAMEVGALTRQLGIRFGDDASSDALYQFVLLPMVNILGDLQDDTDHSRRERQLLNGNHSMDNYELLKVAIENGNPSLVFTAIGFQTAKEFMCRNMDKALKCTDMYYEYFGYKKLQMAYGYVYNIFYDGLINFHFAGQTGDARYRERGENALSQFRDWLRHSDWNFQNKLLLLQAEYYKLMDNGNMAAISYDASIMAAKEHKFIHEEATANELAGIFYSEQGHRQRALSYFLQSVVCYKKWGASAIAREVEAKIEKQFGEDSMNNAGPIR